MFRAKEAGRDGYRFFTAGMNAQALARLDLEIALRAPLDGDEFVLHYQPKLDLDTGRISGAEALLRWHRPGHGLVSPAEFVPVLEDTGLIVRVGAWVIDEACRQIAAWNADGVRACRWRSTCPPPVRRGRPGRRHPRRHRPARRRPGPARTGADRSALMSNSEHTIEVLESLKALGIRIAIDDFGTGYSSLAYLKRFPIDSSRSTAPSCATSPPIRTTRRSRWPSSTWRTACTCR